MPLPVLLGSMAPLGLVLQCKSSQNSPHQQASLGDIFEFFFRSRSQPRRIERNSTVCKSTKAISCKAATSMSVVGHPDLTHNLRSKYVAETTKGLILREIEHRARVEAEARVVADFVMAYDMLLDSQAFTVRMGTCRALGRLASHSSTRAAVVAVQPSARLVALLSDANVKVVKEACFAVSEISQDRGGATSIVREGAPEFLKQLLESQDEDVRKHACWALGQLAYPSSTRAAAVAVQPGAHLVALLG
ncbi:armadillo-type protein [Mycena metata]|uniref:Armadillo-type protein n=1 Tax=Mycena metata TaxID=1033252 RepID=A0AAD7GZY4_9AGAR|nr:armadillo-type protein [Mycena metata]